MDAFKPLIAKVATGSSLTEVEAKAAFDLIFAGSVTPAQLGGLLMALRARGETVAEITGAVAALRARMLRVAAPPGAIDIVGTGGDGHGTRNISTLAALIAAACGVPVAKHGNRAASSKSGASDVMSALGVGLELAAWQIEACIKEAGIGFMAARAHHPAMRHAAPVRAELGTRTIFNLIGPLANPAGVKFQVLGVFARGWLEPLARVLRNLGAKRAWLVHGSDGLDEATITGPTFVTALEDGRIRSFEIAPEDAGISRAFARRSRRRRSGRQRGGASRRARRRQERLSRHRRFERGGCSRHRPQGGRFETRRGFGGGGARRGPCRRYTRQTRASLEPRLAPLKRRCR